MTMRKALTAAVATGLVFSGAASAATMGQTALRNAAPVEDAEQLAGGGIGFIVAAIVAAGVLFVILDDDDNEPASP